MAEHRSGTSPISSLIARWRGDAERLREYGASEQATAVERCIQDCLATLQKTATETVTPAEAAAESGLTADSITRLMRTGKLLNVGTKRRPRARLCDLPRKPMAARTELALLPDSGNSGNVAPSLMRAAVSAKLTGGRRA